MPEKKRYAKPRLRRRERLADVAEGDLVRVTDGDVDRVT
jgi:hypothetical protein